MAQQKAIQGRERFEKELRQVASHKAIPIQQLSWRDVPDKDASDLLLESGGKKRIFTISDFDLINDIEGQIEQIINVAIDNE